MPAHLCREYGCHKCLSISNDKMYENEVKCFGILCAENPFYRSFAHEKENDAVYAIRIIIILEIRIRKLSAKSAFYVKLHSQCESNGCATATADATIFHQLLLSISYSNASLLGPVVVVPRFSFFLSQPILFSRSLLECITILSAHCHLLCWR